MRELIKLYLNEVVHNKLNLDTFITRSKESHGDKYDYSLVDYKNQYTPIKIICPIHGEFEQIPKSHMNGMGCKKCGSIKQSKSRITPLIDFIKRANQVHDNKYTYDKVVYKRQQDKMTITCPKHGDFSQNGQNHLKGAGCPICANEKSSLRQRTPQNVFIDQVEKIHNNKYDYSQVIYKNGGTKIDIVCAKHGVFSQTPNAHLRGQGCPVCGDEEQGLSRRLTTDEFIKRSQDVHGNLYDYSESVYEKGELPIKIICRKHGPFFQTPYNHFGNKQGCPICGRERTTEKQIKTTDDFIIDAILVHGERYDYSLVDYIGNKKPVTIVCKKHGPFNQIPTSHLAGQGCPICANNIQKTTQEFIDDAIKVHGNKYDYSLVKYKSGKKPVTVICPKHGDFNTLPINHIRGVGCPICSESKGERLVSLILERNQIDFERQKKFDGCFRIGKNNKRCYKLPFDFYLPTYNTVIEYDGLQHFRPVGMFGGEKAFQQNKLRDKLKTLYCKNSKIRIIRIPYTMKNNEVESYIKKELGITS
jgi:rubrerythrin